MSNDPDLLVTARGMAEPHHCDDCGELYDEADGDGYAGRCPGCADTTEDEDDDDARWDCPRPTCGYRTPGMSLADRDLLDAHLAECTAPVPPGPWSRGIRR